LFIHATACALWKNVRRIEKNFGQRSVGESEVKNEAGAETQRNADNKLMTEASAFCALGIQPERAGRM
jgi:hypothetical protein